MSLVSRFVLGLNILSTWVGSETATNTISGTSMASPYTASLLAYLLSLYPSKSFDPELSAFASLPVQSFPQRALGTVSAVAHATLPSWMSLMLLPVLETAPTPFPTLTPAQPKGALLTLATPAIFLILPSKTPNLLIFNNATGL